MKRIKVADQARLIRSLLMVLALILIVVLIITWLRNGRDEPEPPTTEPNSSGEPVGLPIQMYQGGFLNLKELPGWLETAPKKEITYPEDGVRGIYISAFAAGNQEVMEENIRLIEESDLNAMVIDFKDDYGKVRVDTGSDYPLIREQTEAIYTSERIAELKKRGIYLIARIVVFRDPSLATTHPEMAFLHPNGQLLETDGQAFVNPLKKEVWDYNVAIAREAIALGFDEIQFDYVRFAEGFERIEDTLQFDRGNYAEMTDPILRNQQAITDFIAYARRKINAYQVKLSVDVFGYIAFDPMSGIGQSMPQIIEQVDVLSAMIYPSHWGSGYFELTAPDREPYRVVEAYLKKEQEIFSAAEQPPISRPWLQAFTARYLGEGNYLVYGKEEIEEQIKALQAAGVDEYLLWQSTSRYPEDVDY